MTWNMADWIPLMSPSRVFLMGTTEVYCLFLPFLLSPLSPLPLFLHLCMYLSIFSNLLQTYYERKDSSEIRKEMKTGTLGET